MSNDDDSLFSQAVQIVLALFHYTLGFLCAVLFLGEEDVKSTGSVPVLLTLGYIMWSSPFVSKPFYGIFSFIFFLMYQVNYL